MKPTYKELLTGSTEWGFTHESGLSYQLKFHSYSEEYNPSGIWCAYLIVLEQMYPYCWDKFRCNPAHKFSSCPEAFDNVWFDSGITFAETKDYYDRKTEKTYQYTKVGWDYNHLWHSEQGYRDDFQSVKRDAEMSTESFLKEHPTHCVRCKYSGLWDYPVNMYVAKGGWWVHNQYKGTFKGNRKDRWEPADD